jgi:hypothetical protein
MYVCTKALAFLFVLHGVQQTLVKNPSLTSLALRSCQKFRQYLAGTYAPDQDDVQRL